jgi:leucyl-tRNA synthetase
VTGDIEDRFHFNTAISAVMELVNDVYRYLNSGQDIGDQTWPVIREAAEATILLLSPVVPHITQEIWRMLGHKDWFPDVAWPSYSKGALEVEKRLVVIQVNGKVRSRIELPVSFTEKEIEEAALGDDRIRHFIGDKKIRKVIVVQHKLVNVVV